MSLVLAGALLSIALNPLLFAAIAPFRRIVLVHSELARRLDSRMDPYAELPMNTERKYLEGQVVLVGYGRIGRRIANALGAHGIPYVVAESNRELVEDLRRKGIIAVSGNAAEPATLIQAHIAKAAMLVIAAPDLINVRQMATIARTLNPDIEIVLPTNSREEARILRSEAIGTVFFAEEEVANRMSTHVVQRFASKPPSP